MKNLTLDDDPLILVPLVIKNVDNDVYRRFKAKVVERGMRIGDAITIAMEKWINEDFSPDSMLGVQYKNKVFYRSIISDLQRKHGGKWLLSPMEN
ncbi:MAG: hypothetical protein ACTSP4_14135 [Candidatus Hodarchaeales archaeon]